MVGLNNRIYRLAGLLESIYVLLGSFNCSMLISESGCFNCSVIVEYNIFVKLFPTEPISLTTRRTYLNVHELSYLIRETKSFDSVCSAIIFPFFSYFKL